MPAPPSNGSSELKARCHNLRSVAGQSAYGKCNFGRRPGIFLMLRRFWIFSSASNNPLLAEPHEKFCVRPSCPPGVDAGVEIRRRLEVLVPEQLADQLVGARIRVQNDFRRDVPK